MITIVDYGLGNVSAFVNVYRRMNIEVATAKAPAELERASKIILPGVGAFDHAMALLDQSGMRQELDRRVLEDRVPILGVCIGMQVLGRSSDEGTLPGLGWLDARVKGFKFCEATKDAALPHMGWNDVRPKPGTPLFEGLDSAAVFYFLHSYFVECDSDEHVIATCDYGISFGCAVQSRNVYGVQFHPEKSHRHGERLLKNFSALP
jgi:glutamine amidotransferase